MPRGAWHCTYIASSTTFLTDIRDTGDLMPTKFLVAVKVRIRVGLVLGLELGLREPQSLKLQGHWSWKMDAKFRSSLHLHCSFLYISLGDPCCGGPQFKHQDATRVRVRVRLLRTVKPAALWTLGLQNHAKRTTALYLHCSFQTFLL